MISHSIWIGASQSISLHFISPDLRVLTVVMVSQRSPQRSFLHHISWLTYINPVFLLQLGFFLIVNCVETSNVTQNQLGYRQRGSSQNEISYQVHTKLLRSISKSKIRFGLSSATQKRFSSWRLWPGHTLVLFDLFTSRDPQVATRLDLHSNVRPANASC